MMIYSTLEKLKEMKLRGMSKGLEDQLAMPESQSLSFDERFGLLVDQEDITRTNIRLASRLRRAKLREDASIENIDFSITRGIDTLTNQGQRPANRSDFGQADYSGIRDAEGNFGITQKLKCLRRHGGWL